MHPGPCYGLINSVPLRDLVNDGSVCVHARTTTNEETDALDRVTAFGQQHGRIR